MKTPQRRDAEALKKQNRGSKGALSFSPRCSAPPRLGVEGFLLFDFKWMQKNLKKLAKNITQKNHAKTKPRLHACAVHCLFFRDKSSSENADCMWR